MKEEFRLFLQPYLPFIMLHYILISSFGFIILGLYYSLFLRKETFFQLNRFTLLFGVFVSLGLPFFKILNGSQEVVIRNTLTTFKLPDLVISASIPNESLIEHSWSYHQLILSTYVVVTLILLIRFLLSNALLIQFIVRQKESKTIEGKSIIYTNGKYATFAYFKYLFWDNSQKLMEDERLMILKHESVHINELHTLDVLLMEVIKVFYWFNPAIYLVDHNLRLQHEYIADQKAKNICTTKEYKKLIVSSLFQKQNIRIANGFQFSMIKSRIKMLSYKPSSQWKKFHSIVSAFLMLSTIVISQACVQDSLDEKFDSEIKKIETDKIYGYQIDDHAYWSEKGPSIILKNKKLSKVSPKMISNSDEYSSYFSDKVNTIIVISIKDNHENLDDIKRLPSSQLIFEKNFIPSYSDNQLDNDALLEVEYPATYEGELYEVIRNEMRYPKEAISNNIEGNVLLEFTINQNGDAEDIKVKESAHELLDKEAMRVARKILKGWNPAVTQGQIVKQKLTLPITFKL